MLTQTQIQCRGEESLIIWAVALLTDRNLYWTFSSVLSSSQSEMENISTQILWEVRDWESITSLIVWPKYTPTWWSDRKEGGAFLTYKFDELSGTQHWDQS